MYSVSSNFQVFGLLQNAPWSRRFTIGASDYSARVISYPSIARQWDNINPSTVTLDLSNDDGAFNFLLTSPATMATSCSLQIGFASGVYSAGGSAEYITAFAGQMDAVQYQGNKVSVTIIDKFQQLADRVVGDTSSPVNYTSSNYLIHDLAWYACTSMGGLSALSSTNNPDIDYASFGSWSSVFSSDNTRVRATFTGQKVVEILQKLSAVTQSAIWIENNKIKFARFGLSDTNIAALGDATVIDTSVTLDKRDMVNQFFVGADYNTTSGSFAITVNAVDSASMVSYGLKQDNSMETSIWLVDSVSALNLAQRVILTKKQVKGNYSVTTPLQSVAGTIGDVITYSDTHLGIAGAAHRCLSETLDMENGTKTYVINQTQIMGGFVLDTSSLDGSDVLI